MSKIPTIAVGVCAYVLGTKTDQAAAVIKDKAPAVKTRPPEVNR